jgi:hypothetical protein
LYGIRYRKKGVNYERYDTFTEEIVEGFIIWEELRDTVVCNLTLWRLLGG